MTKIDTEKFEQVKETEHFIMYLEKKPLSPKLQEVLVFYKKKNVLLRGLSSDKSFVELLLPAKVQEVLLERSKQKVK